MLKLLRQSDIWTKLLVTAVLIFVPLYIKFPLLRIPGTYVSIRMEDFLVAISTLYLLLFKFKNLVEAAQTKIGRAIILFWFVGFVSLVSAYFVTQTISPLIGLLHLVRRIEYMTLFFLGLMYAKTNGEKSIDYVVKLLLLVNVFVFLYGLGQMYLSFPVIVTQNEEYSKGIALRWINGAHINSTFAGHYDLASYLLLVLPVFICMFFLIKNRWQKVFLAVNIAMSYWLLSSAASRISIASFAIALVVSMLLIKKIKALVFMLIISFLIFGMSPALKARYIRIFEVTKEKLTSALVVNAQDQPEVFEDRSTSIRLNVEWPRAIRSFKKNILLGTGYSSINLATDNDYLRALGEVGLLGFAAFSLIFINIGLLIKKSLNKIANMEAVDKAFLSGIIGGIFGALSNAIFIDVFEASKFAVTFWLFIGIAVSTISNYNYGQNE